MTVETPREPWDDDRLDAAFAARSALHPTPTALTTTTLRAVATTRSGSSFGWRPSVAAFASIAILLVVLAASVAVSGGLPIRTDESSPSPTAPAATDAPEVLALPIRSVVEALAVRNAKVDDREIAVHGWFPPFVTVPCPSTRATSPVQPVCPDDQFVLMADPEILVTQNGNGYSRGTPTGPAFQIDLDVFQIHLDDLAGGWQPTEIVVVGHFDDRGSSSCPLELQAACRDRFVVDRIDRVNGKTQPTSQIDLLEGVGMPFGDAEHILDAVRPGVSILSAVHDDGDAGLWQIDPALAEGGSSLAQEARLWVVRVLDAGQLGTYVIVDSSGSLYELTLDGPVLVALSTPGEPVSPSSSPSPTPPAWGEWPPQNAFSVMEFKGDAGRKAFVAIVDDSGLLTSVAEGVPDGAIGDGAFEGFFRDPSGAHRYRLRWTTTVCDREMTVSIARDVARIVIGHAPREGCDAMAIGRDLVLRFTQDVDPAAVELQVIQPTRLP